MRSVTPEDVTLEGSSFTSRSRGNSVLVTAYLALTFTTVVIVLANAVTVDTSFTACSVVRPSVGVENREVWCFEDLGKAPLLAPFVSILSGLGALAVIAAATMGRAFPHRSRHDRWNLLRIGGCSVTLIPQMSTLVDLSLFTTVILVFVGYGMAVAAEFGEREWNSLPESAEETRQ